VLAGKNGGGGFCSANALKVWVGSVAFSVCLLLGAMGFLYSQMSPITTKVELIVNSIEGLSASVPEIASAIPSDIIDTVKPYLQYLGLAVLLPGVLAAVFLLIASGCGLRSKALCCSKCFVAFSDIFLIIALIFYCIFAAIGVLISQPIVASQLQQIVGICDTTVPNFQQIVSDGNANLAELTDAGGNPADIKSAQDSLGEATTVITELVVTCDNITGLFGDLANLFIPGVFCVCAVLLAFVNTQGLCCSEGCCKTNPASSAAAKATIAA